MSVASNLITFCYFAANKLDIRSIYNGSIYNSCTQVYLAYILIFLCFLVFWSRRWMLEWQSYTFLQKKLPSVLFPVLLPKNIIFVLLLSFFFFFFLLRQDRIDICCIHNHIHPADTTKANWSTWFDHSVISSEATACSLPPPARVLIGWMWIFQRSPLLFHL